MVVMLHKGQIGNDLSCRRIAKQGADASQKPEKKQQAEADEGCDDLVFSQCGGKNADR